MAAAKAKGKCGGLGSCSRRWRGCCSRCSLGEAIPGAGHRWRIADHTMIGVRPVPMQKWN